MIVIEIETIRALVDYVIEIYIYIVIEQFEICFDDTSCMLEEF